MALVIRRALAADAATVADVWLRSFRSAYAFPPAHPDEEVRAWVRDHLIPGAEAWMAVANERARRCYARNGFAEVELTDGAGNEEHQPDVRMASRLR